MNVEHRTFHVDLAVRGQHVRVTCDAADVGVDVFEQVRAVAVTLHAGDRVRVAGAVEVRASGVLIIKQVRHLERDVVTPAGAP